MLPLGKESWRYLADSERKTQPCGKNRPSLPIPDRARGAVSARTYESQRSRCRSICWVGSAVCAAVIHGRRAAGSDTAAEYIAVARDRVRLALAGKLRRRPLGRPVYRPGPNDRIARRPENWTTKPAYEASLFA